MGNPVQSDEMPLQPQVLIEPFERWDLEFVGPITPMSKKKRYILFCIDYVTKWVEAKAHYQANEQSVVDFLFEEIFTHFGVLREIVTDQGTQFMSKMVKTIIQQYQICHKVSTPYHPQANGQVESTNKVLEVILTKTIKANHTDWVDRLSEALWAYRTTWRNTTRNSLYELIYGKKIFLPIEL